MKFTYWDNSKIYHGRILFTTEASNISEADKQFEVATGINPVKTPSIGCQIEKSVDQTPA